MTLVPSVPYSESIAVLVSSGRHFLVALPSGIAVPFQNSGETHGLDGRGMPEGIVLIVCKGLIHVVGVVEAQCAF